MVRSSLIAGLLLLFSCAIAANNQLPTSARSIAAINKVEPALIKALGEKNLRYGAPIFIRIFKQSAILEVWLQAESGRFELFKAYDICAQSGRLGPKLRRGDRQAPEGFYFVNAQRFNPWSKFHLSFNLGYPNAYDRAHGRTGSALMVHGDCVSIGCYAMTDSGIEEIYALAQKALEDGQPFFRVHIFPFRLSDEALERVKNNRWYTFWLNLKQGFDYFEQTKIPPNVNVQNKRYVFSAP